MLTFVRAEPFTISATAKETGEKVGEWKVRGQPHKAMEYIQ
jgi:hypothetical protein